MNKACRHCGSTEVVLHNDVKLVCYEFEMMANWCEKNGMESDSQSYTNLVCGLRAALAEARGE